MAGNAHDAATVACGTLVSRILGFLRDLLLAHLLGPAADALLVAFRLPNFFRRLLAEGSLGMAYSAALARVHSLNGDSAAALFGRAAALRLLLLSLPLALLLALISWPLAFALAPGLDGAALSRAAFLLRLCLPYLPLCLASAIAYSHAAFFGNFRPQAWSPALLNIGILLCGGLALGLAAPGQDTALTEYMFCLGLLGGGLAQAVLAWRCLVPPVMPRASTEASFPAEEIGKAVRRLLRLLPVSALGAAPHQLHLLAGTFLASFLASGNISALYFAERLIELPLGLAGAAVGIAALPRLACQAAEKATKNFAQTLADNLRLSAFLSLPATAGLAVLAFPLAKALFGHGAFDPDAVQATAAALTAYALGLPALCATRPLLAAANALNLGGAPLKTAAASLMPLLLVTLAGWLVQEPGSSKGAYSLGFGLAAGAWANAFLLLRLIRRAGIRGVFTSARRSFYYYAAAAAALAESLILLQPSEMGTIALALVIPLSVLAWFGGFWLAGSEDARSLIDFARRGLRKE